MQYSQACKKDKTIRAALASGRFLLPFHRLEKEETTQREDKANTSSYSALQSGENRFAS
mgnify:CR=1 FL=1